MSEMKRTRFKDAPGGLSADEASGGNRWPPEEEVKQHFWQEEKDFRQHDELQRGFSFFSSAANSQICFLNLL